MREIEQEHLFLNNRFSNPIIEYPKKRFLSLKHDRAKI